LTGLRPAGRPAKMEHQSPQVLATQPEATSRTTTSSVAHDMAGRWRCISPPGRHPTSWHLPATRPLPTGEGRWQCYRGGAGGDGPLGGASSPRRRHRRLWTAAYPCRHQNPQPLLRVSPGTGDGPGWHRLQPAIHGWLSPLLRDRGPLMTHHNRPVCTSAAALLITAPGGSCDRPPATLPCSACPCCSCRRISSASLSCSARYLL
jgi:hypothetical protein